MSVVAIRAALETALAAMSPALDTAWENVDHNPVQGTPYQRASVLFAEPENIENAASYTQSGFLQATLCYPTTGGAGDAASRAEAIREAFPRGRALTPVSGVTVTIWKTAQVLPGYVDADRYCIPVRVPFFAHITA